MSGNGTRYTALDGALARIRASKATRLLPPSAQRVLDLGCGRRPVFLERTPAPFRVGVDHAAPDTRPAGIRFVRYDIEGPLPFRTGSFDVVAMLAVLEHVVEDRLERVLDDVHRVLAPGGTLVVTTPPPWTDRVLPMLQRLGAVSEHMMEDHERTFRRSELNHLFARTAFGGTARSGYFELGMNIWVVATKAAANGAKSA